MQADVDMSGRIEETNRPTAMALANGIKGSLFTSAVEKQTAIEVFRKLKPQRDETLIHVLIFSSLLYLLVKEHIRKLSIVIVDPEYTGYEAVIKNRVMSLLRK